MIAKFFKFNKLNTTLKKEMIGGLTTFLAMIYILSVNPIILHNAKSITDPSQTMPLGGLFLITAIATIIATIIMGLLSNVPIALAPSMGLNSMFTFTVANKGGLGYEGALIAVMISGIFLVIASATPFRKLIVRTIPKSINLAIAAAIGCFIAYIGFSDIGLFDKANGLPVAGIGNIQKNYPEIIMGLFVLVLIFIFFYKKVFGSIVLAIGIGVIVSVIIGFTFGKNLTDSNGTLMFSKWNGWDYSNLGSIKEIFHNTYRAFGNSSIWVNPTMYISILVFFIVSMFDTTGTLIGVSETIKKFNPDYVIKDSALLSDTIGVLTCSTICSAPVTSYIESNTGIEQGARSGFASIFTALMFVLAIPLFPIFELVTPTISGAATIFIGVLMFQSLSKIEWKKIEMVIPTFFILILTVVTYSLTNGIAFGLLFYTLIMLINKKFKEIHFFIYIMDFLFIIYFVALCVLPS